jgi:hypothetical protein
MRNDILRKNLWVPEGLWGELKAEASERGQSPSEFIQEAVEGYLDNTQITRDPQ